jgi:hypothetical protein
MFRHLSLRDMVRTVADIGYRYTWDAFFDTLQDLRFDGIATACVFAWEERARESSSFMLQEITRRLAARAPVVTGRLAGTASTDRGDVR